MLPEERRDLLNHFYGWMLAKQHQLRVGTCVNHHEGPKGKVEPGDREELTQW